MRASEVIRKEHKVINLALDGVRRELTEVREAGSLDFRRLEKILDFVRNFVDRCHHAKEEELLFRKLEEKGQAEAQGLLAELRAEHRQGRELLAAIAQAAPRARSEDQPALQTVAGHLRAYLELLTGHLNKEDELLLSLADRLLTPQEQEAVAEDFEKFEASEMGPGVHDKYHALAHELAGH